MVSFYVSSSLCIGMKTHTTWWFFKIHFLAGTWTKHDHQSLSILETFMHVYICLFCVTELRSLIQLFCRRKWCEGSQDMNIWMNPFIYWLRQSCLWKLLMQREILEDLLKPVVCRHHLISFLNSLKQFSFSPSWRTNVNSSCLFLCRMNPRTSSRSSSCGSLRCSMAPSAKKECRGPVRLPLSTTVLEWREPRRGGKGAKIMKG